MGFWKKLTANINGNLEIKCIKNVSVPLQEILWNQSINVLVPLKRQVII
jgi:hypothetical protein